MQTLIMGFLRNTCQLLPLVLCLSLHVKALTGENTSETDTNRVTRFLTRHSYKPHGSSLSLDNPMSGPENVDFQSQLLSWPLSSSEDADRQGVLGEYSEESTETSLLYPNGGGLMLTPTESAAQDSTIKESTQTIWSTSENTLQKPSLLSTEKSTASVLHPTPSREKEPTFSTLRKEDSESHLPFLLSGSIPSHHPDQKSASLESAGPAAEPEHLTPAADTDNWGWNKGMSISIQGKQNGPDDVTDQAIHRGTGSTKAAIENPRKHSVNFSKISGTFLPGGNMDMSTTTCKTSDQSWTPTYPDDFTSNEPLQPSLAFSPSLLVPLYSDWNSAHAIWGFAWEAHIYGLSAIFALFGLTSVVCLLGLPIRCPPGFPFFTMLHFFILGFAGIHAFTLVYDAYSSQDRLSPLLTQLLSELPLPCLISAFSLAFLLLSLQTRNHLSLPLAISTSFSVLPRPCLLLCMCLLHFVVSLGCVGLLQLFHSLPLVILLFPQCVFVCLTVFLSCSYLIFYCLRLVNSKHIYRLNDNGETGGSPEVIRPATCPFSKVEDWDRAAGAGIGSSLCLLGCGGLQLYGILHALGFGGVDGYGFQPWPWWGYQIGCRLCEAGVCLGLSIIGTHPLFCTNNSSLKTLTNPRPGSWSRLSCSSPLRELSVPPQDEANSPVFSSHDSWSQSKQEKLVVCEVVTKRQSEALPLGSMVDPPANGVHFNHKHNQNQSSLPLPTPPVPLYKPKNMDESIKISQSSLDSIGAETDSTGDLRPPSPIDLSRSIDQALFNESLFSHSIFGPHRLFHGSSCVSLSSPCQGALKQGPKSVGDTLFRTTSCGKVDRENSMSNSRASQPYGSLASHSNPPLPPEQLNWKGSINESTQGFCTYPKETGKLRSNSWTNKGQNFPRAIPHLSYHRKYRTLSSASQESQGSGRLAWTKHLSESKQLEWDTAAQAEFVHVCRQIDALSVCSDTIEL